jgi:hypothetical protein
MMMSGLMRSPSRTRRYFLKYAQHELEEAWRRRLKIVLHGIRGSTALLVEMEEGTGGDDRCVWSMAACVCVCV